MIGAQLLPRVLAAWDEPSHEFRDRSAWSLWNAYTSVLGQTQQVKNPSQTVAITIRLQHFFSREIGEEQERLASADAEQAAEQAAERWV